MRADAVVHFRVGALPASPWLGVAPLRRGKTTAAVAAAVEGALTAESRLPVGRIAAYTGSPAQVGDYGRELVRGGLTVTGATSGGIPLPGGQEPSTRLTPGKYGPEPVATMEALRTSTGQDILSAFGVAPALFEARRWQRPARSVAAVRLLRGPNAGGADSSGTAGQAPHGRGGRSGRLARRRRRRPFACDGPPERKPTRCCGKRVSRTARHAGWRGCREGRKRLTRTAGRRDPEQPDSDARARGGPCPGRDRTGRPGS